MSQMFRLNFKLKLVLTFLIVGLLPLLTASFFNYFQTSREISKLATERVELVAKSKVQLITGYFDSELNALNDLASNPITATATQEFSESFHKSFKVSDENLLKYEKSLLNFYTQDFGSKYKDETENDFEVTNFLSGLDQETIVSQYDFISSNPNPLGEKDKLEKPDRESPYRDFHAKYHSYFREYQKRHGLYDLFIVDTEGRLVYSVFKETDFGADLKKGPLKDSNLGKVARKGLKLLAGEIHVEDFAPYTPSFEAPASFASTPIWENNKLIGTLIIQFPLDRISEVAASRDGLGQKGQTLLVGSDLKLRANAFRQKEFTVKENFKPDSKISVESPALLRARDGKSGVMTSASYDGLATLTYYQPIQIKDITWYMAVELDESEVYASLSSMRLYNWFFLILGSVVITLVSLVYGSRVSSRLRNIGGQLNLSNDKISEASQKSASSAIQLREAATEQAASLQETMASTEEISAMVNQNAESAGKVKTTVDLNQKEAEEGSRRVQEVLEAIHEIKLTNDQILDQMETSNKEFGNIVKIISEIGEKTNVINEIVFQTKLLSFNASVEAARAGEHGKGFAVVAEEVGNLAQMSGNAAKEITTMLSNSIKEVNGIVEKTTEKVEKLVEVGKDKISMGQSTAQRARDVLDKITENARSISSMVAEITHASKEQSQGIQEINKAISQLDQVTQQNSTVAQQSSNLAEGLKSEAEHLTEAVSSLLHFVEGKTANSKPVQERPQKRNAHVVSLHSSKKRIEKRQENHDYDSVQKKASGSSLTPRADDPGFEDF